MEMAMRSVALITALAVTIFSGARAVKVAKPETKMACFNDNAEQAEKTSDEGMTCRPLKTKDRLTAVYRQDFHHTKACVVATTVVLLASIPSVSIAQDAEAVGEVEEAEIVVQATRSGRRVQDEPLRVEVIGREEIEEKALMRPGSVAMVLGETGSLRVQVTSPALGSSNIRVQGMDGRYTQLLADGLPLYGGQTSSLGLLQIPPTDLDQVEVIKGSVSALYGASALGGVINLVSRRPAEEPQLEALLNATTRNGQDATAYVSTPINDTLSASLTGGLHWQTAQDLDDDGWRDIASHDRWSLRPRVFWTGSSGAKLYFTAGVMQEDRLGGTNRGRSTPDGNPFPQSQRTKRLDGGLVGRLGRQMTINREHFQHLTIDTKSWVYSHS